MPNIDAKLNWGPIHTNSNVICAVDVRVGGEDATNSDLLEVCFLPLNHSYRPHENFVLFNPKIRPSWKVDKKLARLSNDALEEYKQSSFDSVTARTAFEQWCEHSLKLKHNKKVLPLVWDWTSKKPFIEMWLQSSFGDLIHDSVRDMLPVLNFMNDRADFWGDEIIYKHPTFEQLVKRSEVELIDRNSLGANCKALSDVYRYLLKGYIAGYAPKS
jgi:hypothetical protein